MAHVNDTATGAVVTTATQLSRYWSPRTIAAGATINLDWLQTRGAPRVLAFMRQTAGAVGATVTVEASISDANAPQTLIALPISANVAPPGVPLVLPQVVPSKFMRFSITAPPGNAVTIELALMVAQ